MSSRPQRRSLIGSYRYSVVIKPNETEYSEQMTGVLELYDGKHVTQTHKYSSFDKLVSTIINFWEKMLGSEVNVHRFANWLAEYFSDVGVTNIDFYQLIEIVRNLGKGVSLQSSGIAIREAKVVPDPIESTSKKREMTTDVESLVSPITETVKPSELFKKEETISPSISTMPPIKVEEAEPEAPPVNTLLKPSEVILKRDTIFEAEPPKSETPKKIMGDPIVTKPSPKIDKKVKPIKSLLRPSQYLKKQETIDVVAETTVRPSQLSDKKIIDQVKTKVEKSVQKPTKKKEVVEQKLAPPSEGLLRPSEYLKDKETAIEKVEHLRKPSELIRKESTAFIHPVRKIDPELNQIPAPPGTEGKKIKESPSDSKSSAKPVETLAFEIEISADGEEMKDTSKDFTDKKSNLRIIDITGVGEKIAMLLKDGGVKTIDQLVQSKPEELSKIRGIGITSAKKLIYGANALINEQ
ncbi:MAG: helix-hairpin-helix domain-containing protein [Candidatus Heimdallarchaeaceae archaeon]